MANPCKYTAVPITPPGLQTHGASDEITIWLNGGPGCSSLTGFFQENGRFLWQPGTYAPVENPYSWVNLTNMLCAPLSPFQPLSLPSTPPLTTSPGVDQPVGAGFSIGDITATNEEDIAADFLSFLKNFQDTFAISNYKIYLSGESYAARYTSYIGAAMLDRNDTCYYNLSGLLAFDAAIGQFDVVQEQIPLVPYVQANNAFLTLNSTFLAQLSHLHESCGYAAYLDQYLRYPPSGPQPPQFLNYTTIGACDVFDAVNQAAFQTNPCFDIYSINQQCPLLWDVLAFVTELVYQPDGAPDVYFNRSDVKAAMHAPPEVEWALCTPLSVFVGGVNGTGGPEQQGDLSPNPIEGALPRVIEATNRVLISNGDYVSPRLPNLPPKPKLTQTPIKGHDPPDPRRPPSNPKHDLARPPRLPESPNHPARHPPRRPPILCLVRRKRPPGLRRARAGRHGRDAL